MPPSRHVSSRVPNPIRDAIEVRFRCGEYGDYGGKLNKMDIGNDLYMAIFPKECKLTIDVDRMPQADQDLIHDFVLQCAEENKLIADMVDEKPLTAPTLLALARKHLRKSAK